MANPKKRKTHSAAAKGRAHLALKKIVLTKCPKCKQARRPHTVCQSCGHYRSREIFKPVIKTGAKTDSRSAKEKNKK